VLYTGYLSVDSLTVRTSHGGIVTREIERHGDAVAVLPFDASSRCALVVRPLLEFVQTMEQGGVADAKLLLLLTTLRMKSPELFT
jgi:hypothetical protein